MLNENMQPCQSISLMFTAQLYVLTLMKFVYEYSVALRTTIDFIVTDHYVLAYITRNKT